MGTAARTKLAEDVIREYRERGVADYEVGIYASRSLDLEWYFSTEREREGLPPLEGLDLP